VNRMHWIGALLLGALLAAPTQAQQDRDLSGLWTLSGALPNGDPADGAVALTPLKTPNRYRALVVDASGASWRASVWSPQPGTLLLRPYKSTQGAAGALVGATEPWVAELGAAGEGFEGGYPGGPAGKTLSLAPAALPRLSLDGEALAEAAAAVRARPGAQTLGLSCEPAAARKLVRFFGAQPLRPSWNAEGLAIEGQPGSHRLEARLGGSAGPLLATLEVSVDSDVLARVRARVAEVKASGQTPIVIFDLDDTLFDTRYRTAALLEDYHRTHGEPRLELVPVETVHYDLEDTLADLGFNAHEIEGQTYTAIRGDVWPKFFKGENLLLDKPVPGAVEAVNSLAADALIVYLTGRKTFVSDFSERALAQHGFPTPSNPGSGPGVRMFHKPKSYAGQANPGGKLGTDEFKGLVTKTALPPLGVVVAAFDNEPKNCLAFQAAAPADALIVHLDTLYDADSPALNAEIEVIPDLLEGGQVVDPQPVPEPQAGPAAGTLARVRARVAEVKASGQTPIVIFDLDDTLFDTRGRTASLLQSYHANHGEPRLAQVPLDAVHYDLEDTLAELGFTQHELEGQTFKAIRNEVWPKFFKGESLLLDGTVPGAVEAVRALAADALIVYLTGRKTFVSDFSERALAQRGFPTPSNPGSGPGVRMFHKPKSYAGQANPGGKLGTDEFKGLVTKNALPPLGVVVAAFDNEPKNCLAFQAAAPEAIVVHLDTLYDADSPALTGEIEVVPSLVE